MWRKGLSARLEQGDVLMERNRVAFDRNGEAFERNRQAFERMMAAFDRFERAFDEHQVFMRDMHRRSEIVTQQMISDHQEFMKELKESAQRSDRSAQRSDTKFDQILAESRAQREALFALIDRLPPPKSEPV